jgi:hypothetical protein
VKPFFGLALFVEIVGGTRCLHGRISQDPLGEPLRNFLPRSANDFAREPCEGAERE